MLHSQKQGEMSQHVRMGCVQHLSFSTSALLSGITITHKSVRSKETEGGTKDRKVLLQALTVALDPTPLVLSLSANVNTPALKISSICLRCWQPVKELLTLQQLPRRLISGRTPLRRAQEPLN